MSVNKVILIGHVGDAPKIRHTSDNRPIASFSLATNESWRDKNTGEKRQLTDWHRIVVFNEGLCKVIEQYVKKGSKLYIEGKSKTRKWTSGDGVERYVTEIVVQGFGDTITMLDRAERAPDATGEGDYGSAPPMDDEIPF